MQKYLNCIYIFSNDKQNHRTFHNLRLLGIMGAPLDLTPDICASKEYSLKKKTIFFIYLNEKGLLMYIRK